MTPAHTTTLPVFTCALAPPSEQVTLDEIADAVAAVLLSARQRRAERAAAEAEAEPGREEETE